MYYLTPMYWISIITSPLMLVILSIVSEVLGIYRIYPLCYTLKVCVDIPKEIIKLTLIQRSVS